MTGTFKLTAGTVFSQSGVWAFIGVANLVDAANTADPLNNFAFFNTVGARTARFVVDDQNIIVDGVPTAFNLLPSGFKPTSLTIHCSAQNFLLSGAGNVYISFEPLGFESGPFIDQQLDIPFSFDYPSVVIPSILSLSLSNFGVRFDLVNGGSNGAFGGLYLTGDYIIEQFNLNLDLSEAGQNVTPGQTSTIKSLDGKAAGFITQVFVGDKKATIIYRDKYRIRFKVPNVGGPSSPHDVTVRGKQFKGVKFVAAFTVIYAEASGIYELVPSKSNDTLYIHDVEETTEDFAIPEPFAKTGFIE
jgi:hypothetical protein